MNSPRGTEATTSITFWPVEKVAYTPSEACEYLCLPSKDALGALVRRGELTPMTYAKEHRYHRQELDRFLAAQVDAERQRRGLPQC